MRTFIAIMIRILLALFMSYATARGQNATLITVEHSDRYEIKAKSVQIRNMRYVKLRINAHDKQELEYTTRITATKEGLQRNFGDGKLYFSVQQDRGVLEFRPEKGQSVQPQEQTWIKSLFTKEVSPNRNIRVEKAEVSLMIPADIDLEVESSYTDIWVKGMRHSLSILNRYGKVYVDDHLGEVRVEQQYGDMNITKMTGELMVQSRYGKVDVQDHTGDMVLSTSYCKSTLTKAAEGGSMQLTGNYSRFDVSSAANRLEFDGKYNTATIRVQPLEASGSVRINQSYSTIDLNLMTTAPIRYRYTNQFGSIIDPMEEKSPGEQPVKDGLRSGGPTNARFELWITNRNGTVKVKR